MNSTATLLGHVELTWPDPARDTLERVYVRQLPVKDYPRLQQLIAQGDECRLVEFYCGKPDGWAETLRPDTHTQIIEAAEELNRDFFSRWEARQRARQQAMQQQALESSSLLEKLPKDVVDRLLEKITGSPSSSPTAQPPAA